jgi:very-long-chain (3R)-3-hydroxyacyl-CoA dehydratase
VADTEQPQTLAPAANYYLILYNALSCLGWCYVFVMTCLHLSNTPLPEIFNPSSNASSAFSFQGLVECIHGLVEELIREAKSLLTASTNPLIATIIPPQLLGIYGRMTTTYDIIGCTVAIVQTAAALEIVHVFSRLVKSPISTTVMQVYSRLFLVWGVAHKYEQVCW